MLNALDLSSLQQRSEFNKRVSMFKVLLTHVIISIPKNLKGDRSLPFGLLVFIAGWPFWLWENYSDTTSVQVLRHFGWQDNNRWSEYIAGILFFMKLHLQSQSQN